MCSHILEVVTYIFSVSSKSVQGFRSHGVSKFALSHIHCSPVDLVIDLYNRLYYSKVLMRTYRTGEIFGLLKTVVLRLAKGCGFAYYRRTFGRLETTNSYGVQARNTKTSSTVTMTLRSVLRHFGTVFACKH